MVRDTDPWRVTLRVSRGDERLVVTVDDDLAVLEAHRERA